MEYSKNYDKVKRWYDMNMWDEARVRNAVEKGWITEDEFTEITGLPYNEDPDPVPETEPTESTDTVNQEPEVASYF